MIFSVGIKTGALKDVRNIREQLPELDRARLDLTLQYIIRVELREDAHTKGDECPGDPSFRKLSRGFLEVFYRLRPLEDRYVEVSHFRKVEVNPKP